MSDVSDTQPTGKSLRSRRLSTVLWTTTGLFACRVAAQPLALRVEHPWLPAFDRWYSGAVPYPWLLMSQVVILAAMVTVSRGVSRHTVRPRSVVGRTCVGVGAVYFGVMVFRLALGLTLLRDSRWFASWLPTLFHLVLATFLLTLGRYHLSRVAAVPSGRQ